MRFPCEYIASDFLPGLRIRVAYLLRQNGLSQTQIAKKLSVKQPVIVSYLQSYQQRIVEEGEDNYHLDNLAEIIAKYMLEGKSLPYIMRTVCTRCKNLRVDSFICSKHKEMIPELKNIQHCDICSGFKGKVSSTDERTIILNELTRLLKEIQTIEGLVYWIPEIGSQLALCNEQAEHPDDVASFPGRIIKIEDEVVAVREPSFGVSTTMSKFLLWIRQFQPKVKWIMSIKNNQELASILNDLQITYAETEELDKQMEEILTFLGTIEKIDKIKILADKGSPGYEAIAYIFGENSKEIKDILHQICEKS